MLKILREIKGNIFDIQRFSVHDGPGIRCNVFLKGCNLRCRWCHNPESYMQRPREISFVASRCIGCGYCFGVCPNGCHRTEDEKHVLDWENCARCGLCAAECYSKALTVVGREITAGEVISEVMRDRMFYETSGGGITLSGGEPMLQRDFTSALLTLAKDEGLHTVMETNAAYDFNLLDGIKENVDLFYVDYKATGGEDYLKYTGTDGAAVMENIQKLHDGGHRVLLRCPIVPSVNDTEEHFRKIAELTAVYPELIGAELLPYHRLGTQKTARFGLEGEIYSEEYEAPSKETERDWIDAVRGFGGRVVNEDAGGKK